jgi:hypothetical protein
VRIDDGGLRLSSERKTIVLCSGDHDAARLDSKPCPPPRR